MLQLLLILVLASQEDITADHHLALGAEFQRNRMYSDAYEQFQKAYAKDSSYAEVFNHFALLHIAIATDENMESDRVAKYLNNCRNDSLLPDSLVSEDYLQTAISASRWSYMKAIEMDPERADLWMGLGYVEIIVENWNAALVAYQKSIEYDSKRDDVYATLAYIYGELGNLDEQLAMYHKAIEINPEDTYLSGLQMALWNAGRYIEAEEVLTTWLEKYPDDIEQRRLRGWIRLTLEKYEFAKDDFQFIYDRDSTDITNLRYLADALHNLQQDTVAINYIRKVAEASPEDPEAWRIFGLVLISLNSIDEGTSALQKAYQLAPDDVNILFALDVQLEKQQRYKEAITAFESACKINTNNSQLYLKLGELYKNIDDFTNAHARLDYVLEQDPNNTYAHYFKGTVYEKQKLYNKAIKEFEQAKSDPTIGDVAKKQIERMNQWIKREKALKEAAEWE
jgi:superkiller protein 3